MMCIVPVSQEDAKAIFARQQRFVFTVRHCVDFKQEDVRVALYIKAPGYRIAGYFKAEDAYRTSPDKLWELVCEHAGISREAFLRRVGKAEKATAIKVGDLYALEKMLDLPDLGLSSPFGRLTFHQEAAIVCNSFKFTRKEQ